MTRFVRAVADGFRRGASLLPAAVYLYGAALAFASVATAPLSALLHGALDGQPGARRMVADGGLEVFAELGRSSPGALGAAAFAGVLPLVLLFVPLLIVLAGGVYGLAAGRAERPWSAFWLAGATRFRPFVVLAALGAVYTLGAGAVASGVIAGVAAATKGVSGAAAFWFALLARGAVGLFAVITVRTVVGFGFACRETLPDGRALPAFGRSLRLSWRRVLAAHGIGALFLALQALAAAAALALARLAGGDGRLAAILAQAGWFGVAWLHVVEARARIVLAAAEWPEPAAPTLPEPAPDLASPEGIEGFS